MFTHDPCDDISSNLGIYADDTTLYPCFSNMFSVSDKDKQAVALENDLISVVNWIKEWIVNCNAAKTKKQSFNNQKYTFLSSINMAEVNLQEPNPFHDLS